ncbi:unnamed protein product [Symbiodinium sp. CCMP2456]|nr:unnamed protein product [Symbiodinium sp. CCMP2456]
MPPLQAGDAFHPATKTTADFMCRYMRKMELSISKALDSMTFKSFGIVCDASPKAKMVWLPLFFWPDTIGLGTLQRLSALLPSTATSDSKLEACGLIADSRTRNVLGETKKSELAKKLWLGLQWPKALNSIKQDKLASRQELKALMCVMSQVGVDIDQCWPQDPLIPRVPGREERKTHEVGSENFAFIYDRETGKSRWDVPMPTAGHLRLVVCADHGSPMHTCFQFLAQAGASIHLIRDEDDNAMRLALQSPQDPVAYAGLRQPFERGWGQAKPDDLLMQMFQRDILKENNFEETSDEKLNFERVMEILGQVLTSEEMFGLFRVARNVLAPFREHCLELVALCSSGLGMIPDIATGPTQVLTVKFQRAGNVLREGFGMYLAAVHEMEQYALYLRSAPSKAAGLLSSLEDAETKNKVIDEMRQEWELVQALESVPSGAAVLKANCNYCSFQSYRELMTGLEKSKWVFTDECRALVAAWFPAYCWSAGIESVFADMQDACKRSNRSDCGSLPNLHAVGVRCLQNRLCVPGEAPDHLQLEPDDWLGRNVPMDNILKPFPSTSAFFHNQHCLNFMQGKEPKVEATGFWMGNCVSNGMLFKHNNKFYALQLMELPYRFEGPLPERKEVCFFSYTLHVCDTALEAKCGTAVLLRRGHREFSLLSYLVHAEHIMSCTNACLTELLQKHDITMPKNAAKAHRIKRVLEMDHVKEACGEKTIQKLLLLLQEQEAKKKGKTEDDQNQEAEIDWDELKEDPAAEACRELLARLDEEQEKEEQEAKEEAKEDTESKEAKQLARMTDSQVRESRAMLSSTASLPDELLRRFPVPEGSAMHQTVHCDSTLPHFQGRLLGGAFYEGKQPGRTFADYFEAHKLSSNNFDAYPVSVTDGTVIQVYSSSLLQSVATTGCIGSAEDFAEIDCSWEALSGSSLFHRVVVA